MQGSARGERRRAQIVETALGLVLERGFSALTVDEVARTAGASKTTLMRFFGGRPGLLEATLALEMDLVFGPLEASVDDLDRFGAAFQDVLFSPRCLQMLRFVVGESVSDPALGEAFRALVLGRLASMIRPAVAAAVGQPIDSDSTGVAVDRYLGDLLGLEILRALSGGRPDRERLASYRARACAGLR